MVQPPLQNALRLHDAGLCQRLLAMDADVTHQQSQEPLPSVEDQPFKGIVEYIKEQQSRPRSLQRQARLVILSMIDFRPGLRRHDDPIGKLELPKPIDAYMRWNSYFADRMGLIKQYCS